MMTTALPRRHAQEYGDLYIISQASGVSYEMPRIPQTYIDCAVYLYPSRRAAERNSDDGGCGALVGVPFTNNPNLPHLYVVTNVHVARDNRVIRYNTDKGSKVVDLSAGQWIGHPDGSDVIACPLRHNVDLDGRFSVISTDGFMTRAIMAQIPLRHGDELFMVSRYLGHPGDSDVEPIVRFGTLAKSRPITIDNQESFLAEMRSLSGHSGSPTFVFFYGMQARLGADSDDKLPKPAVYFMGLDWGHPPQRRPIIEPGRGPVAGGLYVNDNSGIACVVPAWKVTELLNQEDFVNARREIEQDMHKP
jgi:hypothetical protein